MVDKAAKAACSLKTPKHFATPTQAFLNTKAKVLVSKGWNRMVNTHKPSPGTSFLRPLFKDEDGSTLIAHALKYPTRNLPTEVFKETSREVFSRVTQVLTGHGYIGSYYHRFNIPNTSPWCKCSVPGAPVLHTREHVLRECSRHQEHRPILAEADEYFYDLDWSVDTLGEPKSRLPALVKFLTKSGTFTKLDTPFSLNLILPPPRPKKPP